MIPFFKYQGTGNDFVLIDQRKTQWLKREDTATIAQICNRHFGVGADGVILLQLHEQYDFEMIYFNSDGRESSMCGNGGRCIVAFAHALGVIEQHCRFLAIDGLHEASIQDNWVELKMSTVTAIEQDSNFFYLDTGSPHYVAFVEDLQAINIIEAGKAIRYNDRFKAIGTNVNFVEITEQGIEVATYERGVEDETLSCGTGVTAAAISYALKVGKGETSIPIQTKGGRLEVRFQQTPIGFEDIWLCGAAQQVFEGRF